MGSRGDLEFWDTLRALASFGNASSGARDGVVAEMCRAIPYVGLVEFWIAFRTYMRTGSGSGEFWQFLELEGHGVLRF